jgi:arsenate reductase
MCENKEKVKVLFLCTGNACRSQMAEGWARHLKGDVIDAYSAGVAPAGLSSTAAKVMAEAGVDISRQTSKHVNTLEHIDFDYVLTLCDNARRQCPVFAGKAKQLHRPFDDPTFLLLGPDERLAAFRDVRDEIRAFIERMPQSLIDAKKGHD